VVEGTLDRIRRPEREDYDSHVYQSIAEDIYEKFISKSKVIGLGSGLTVSSILKHMKRLGENRDIKFVITSLQIKNSAQALGLNMIDESYIPDIDFVLDGADQIDSHFNMIKGGGGALLREKIVISAAKSFVIVGHSNKYVDTFNIPIPVEVHPFARSFVLNELLSIGATPKLRMLDKGYPFVTENGNIIYDTSFTPFQQMHEMEVKIKTIPGVMEVGIFTKCADAYYVINPNNTFTILNSSSAR
jgi:ribose 5-phosphate isomerase A